MNCKLVWINALVFVSLFATCGFAQAQETVLLTHARIFDVVNGKLDEEQKSILISGNSIRSINAGNESSAARVIDLKGRVVLPGLIDLHSHLLLHPYDEATWNEQVLNESLELRTIRGTVAARKTLAAGFTTIRDLGTEGAGFADVALRDAINQGIIVGPRVYTATKALVTTGGYGPMGFDPRWRMPVGAQTADGVAECRKVTREQIAAGADWIKIYADYRRRPGDPSTPTFSQEELNAIVDEASSAGVPVSAHATTDEGIRRSVKAGVKTIEHGYEASLETLQLMRENGVVLCPTLTASESMSVYGGWDPRKDPDPARITTAKKLMKHALESGVTIACGSDVGVFSHGDNSRELELLFAYGMSIEDVIRSTTITAANVLGDKKLGQVQPDFTADLIVVNENPMENLFTLQDPVFVIKGGKVAFDQVNGPAAPETMTLQTSDFQSPTIVEERIQLNSNDQLTEVIRQLEMASPNISEEDSSSTAPRRAGDANPSSDNSPKFQFRIEQNGTFALNDQPVAKGDLARFIARQIDAGVKAAKVIVSGKIDPQKLVENEKWLKGLGVDSVEYNVSDD